MTPDGKPVVLVVDDMPLNLQIATSVLRSHFLALAATDGEKALGLLARRTDVDLILLDVMMPGIDGYETCRRLKKDPKTAHIPVVFLSALGTEEDWQKAIDVGALEYIKKPFDPELLLARVFALLTAIGKSQPTP